MKPIQNPIEHENQTQSFLFFKKKKDLGIDELLKPSQHSKRLVFGGTKIVLKAKRFPLRLHYTRRRLFRRVQNDRSEERRVGKECQ